ncbi:RNA methyltransferase [Thalassotalea sp. M1531]|uniref:RNA methyltransferase n=1 Tax=Thalassotalea algicola TaxID=2716224 RepID=A0A7Y0LDZ3_9GAMM|nr:RNA methyltransferase [Thalassotalea algicola]NMP32527.1 RNA methyltransferase [Thalassotalea algicola]
MSSYIGLTNPKGPTNVGSVLRAAGCFNAAGVYYSGTRYTRAAKFNTDTHNVHSTLKPIACENLHDVVPPGCKVICVDLIEGATPLPEFSHPENAFYIFGPEDGSISQQVINSADEVVYIPTLSCLNLAASVNIVLYDRQAKLACIEASDSLIINSRDTNNKTRKHTDIISN